MQSGPFKGLHPYWEMQYALKAKEDPTEMNVGCFTASLQFAGKKGLPEFHGRAPEIFSETLVVLRKSSKVSRTDLERLENVLKQAGIQENKR